MRNSLVGSVVALAACGSSPSDPAQFEQATDQQLTRVMASAMSFDSVLLSLTASGYAGLPDSADGCPKITTEGTRRHIVGGCNTEDSRIEGELFLDNVPGFLDDTSDRTKPSSIEANDFLVSGGEGGDLRFDGTLTFSPGGDMEASLDTDAFGIDVHTESKLACVDGNCSYNAASIDVDGLGSASVKGTFSFGTGLVNLQVIGKDTLTISTEGNCVTFQVGGRGGKQCNDEGSGTLSGALGAIDPTRGTGLSLQQLPLATHRAVSPVLTSRPTVPATRR